MFKLKNTIPVLLAVGLSCVAIQARADDGRPGYMQQPQYMQQPEYAQPQPRYVQPQPEYIQQQPMYVQPEYIQPPEYYGGGDGGDGEDSGGD